MVKRIAQAWAFAAILLLPDYIDLTSSEGDARMRSPVPLTRIALAHLTDIAIVAILFFSLMAGLRRLSSWSRIRWCLMAVLPPLLLARNRELIPFDFPWALVLVLAGLWAVLLAILIVRAPGIATKLSRAASAVLTGFAVFAAVMTWQLGSAALWRPGPQSFTSASAPGNRRGPRLVWIIFDELAYRPTFEARDTSLKMPNFDRLRGESTLYTEMIPIAYRTTKVIPSLMLGRVVTGVDYSASNRYTLKTLDDPHWQTFDANATLIGMATQKGLTTSMVGWYIPYCPIFAGVATDCYWSNEDAQDRGPTSLNVSFAENVGFPLRMLVEQTFWPRRAWTDVARWNAEGHIASVEDVSQHALATAAVSNADILYLHLPAPHPPAFWDRHTGKFAIGGSYLDSLDYSDRLLGQILDLLESQPRWAETMLIVQGDHSWRTEMWRPLPGWSAEDEQVSNGGQWDPRPVLLIHAPGQESAQTVALPTSLMIVHDEVAAEIESIAKRRAVD
jgi:hypothetical protein